MTNPTIPRGTKEQGMSEELKLMTDAPERIWAWGHWYGGSQYYARHQADGGSENEFERTLYLRADTAIPRAEADAMVAAAYEAARNAAICAKSDYAAPTARIDIANAIDKLAAAAIRAPQETNE